MLDFLGTFSVNFEIPDYWGIGKSVSKGFGTIKRINNTVRVRVKEPSIKLSVAKQSLSDEDPNVTRFRTNLFNALKEGLS